MCVVQWHPRPHAASSVPVRHGQAWREIRNILGLGAKIQSLVLINTRLFRILEEAQQPLRKSDKARFERVRKQLALVYKSYEETNGRYCFILIDIKTHNGYHNVCHNHGQGGHRVAVPSRTDMGCAFVLDLDVAMGS